MKKSISVIDKMVAAVAINNAKSSANSVCMFVAYQPELPEAVKKLRKF